VDAQEKQEAPLKQIISLKGRVASELFRYIRLDDLLNKALISSFRKTFQEIKDQIP
jgi:hypothetical protein